MVFLQPFKPLFANKFTVSEQVVNILKLSCNALNLDSTSFHVDGRYNSDSEVDEEDLNCIRLCRGYSRDHRPELNQAILLLLTENQAGIPLFMAASSGNINDNTNFKEIIHKHIKSLKDALNSRYFIGDSALYTTDIIESLQGQNQLFITRVPTKIKMARELTLSAPLREMTPVEDAEGYEAFETLSDHAGVAQRCG